MSDIFDFGDVDTSGLDVSSLVNSAPDLSNFSMPSLSDIFNSASGTPLVAPVLNLPLPTSTGISGILGDINKLVTGVYQGEANIVAAQNAADLARAKAANQLETVRTTPNIWLVLGLGAAGLFTLELMGKRK